MSEAELHLLAGRLQGARRAAAARGELRFPLPVGYVRDDDGIIVLDPDEEVQAAIADVFACFEQTGSATRSSARSPTGGSRPAPTAAHGLASCSATAGSPTAAQTVLRNPATRAPTCSPGAAAAAASTPTARRPSQPGRAPQRHRTPVRRGQRTLAALAVPRPRPVPARRHRARRPRTRPTPGRRRPRHPALKKSDIECDRVVRICWVVAFEPRTLLIDPVSSTLPRGRYSRHDACSRSCRACAA